MWTALLVHTRWRYTPRLLLVDLLCRVRNICRLSRTSVRCAAPRAVVLSHPRCARLLRCAPPSGQSRSLARRRRKSKPRLVRTRSLAPVVPERTHSAMVTFKRSVSEAAAQSRATGPPRAATPATFTGWGQLPLDAVCRLLSVCWHTPVYQSCRPKCQEDNLEPFSFQSKKRKAEAIQLRPCCVHLMDLPLHVIKGFLQQRLSYLIRLIDL